MERVWPLYAPSLTGCMLVASLFFGCPDTFGARIRPVADRPPPATVGIKSLPPWRMQIGMASWYGRQWQGRLTASGERYDQRQPTAAHRTAPLGTQAVVTNLANGRKVRVRITDRGPHTRQRILDLSYEAARRLDIVRTGAARVKVEFLVASQPLT